MVRMALWVRAVAAQVRNGLRRLRTWVLVRIGRARPVSSSVELPGEAARGVASGFATDIRVTAGGTPEERLGNLEQRVAEVARSVEQETTERRAAVERAQRETEQRLRGELYSVLDRHKRIRQVGFALIVLGAALLDVGNFL
jgi:hypothetical protein